MDKQLDLLKALDAKDAQLNGLLSALRDKKNEKEKLYEKNN